MKLFLLLNGSVVKNKTIKKLELQIKSCPDAIFSEDIN